MQRGRREHLSRTGVQSELDGVHLNDCVYPNSPMLIMMGLLLRLELFF